MSPADDDASRTDPRPGSDGGGAQASLRTFAVDEIIARRYRVVRFIARGGMGEVYEVEDSELSSRIALKTIRVDLAGDEAVLERFRSEISLARRVTHANVCRLFDLGFHETPRGRITFLTMELLAGQSLRQRILAGGRFSVAEALPLVEQMAAGLSAAHRLGVIHRDFKSDNVMLVPSASTAVPRVVITDFGMARSSEASTTLPTTSGELKGTPAYMAPEQLTNGTIGSAVDLYALGVVLYEMVTATLPFSGGNAMAVAVRRLTTKPIPPRQLAPGLDPRWEQTILRCLEREPARRFADVAEVMPALVGAAPAMLPRGRWRPAALALGLLLLFVAGAIGWRHHRRAPSTPERRALAVLGLRNLSGRAEAAWLGTALCELLAAEVTAQGELRRVPDDSVARARRDLRVPDGLVLSRELLQRLRATLDSDYVLDGAYLAVGDGQVRLELVLQDARSGETLASDSATGRESALLELVSQSGQRLRRRLGLRNLSAAEVEMARASLPADPSTARLYADGLSRLRRSDALGARSLLQQATERDPGFPLGHAALAEAWRQLGRQADETREAQLAWEHAAGLPRAEQLSVEANLRVANKQWPRALELCHSLYDFFPGSLDYGLQLADVQEQAGQLRAALATVTGLRRDVPAASRDPRVELVEARICQSLGDFRCEDAAAQRASAKGRALEASELVGDALLFESYAALTLGDRPRAAARAAEAWELFVRVDNPFKIARALRRRGSVAYKAGQLTVAHELVTQSVALFDKLGAGDDLANSYNTLGGIESDRNHHAEAMRFYGLALPLYEAAADRAGVATVELNLGQELHTAHRYRESEAQELRALAVDRELGNRRGEAITLESLGALHLDRGELARAVETEQEAIGVATQIHDVTTMAQTRSKLAQALHRQGKVAAAEESFKQAIASLQQLGETWRTANAEVKLARLYLDVGRVGEAESLARSAVGLHARAAVDTGGSGALLARALVARGKLPEARAAIDEALARAHPGDEGLELQTAAAEVEIAERHPERAVARLQGALKTEPALPERLDAELVLARAELAARQPGAARTRLRAVAEEARAHGFTLVARHATELTRGRGPS